MTPRKRSNPVSRHRTAKAAAGKKHGPQPPQHDLEAEVLAFVQQHGRPATTAQIADGLGMARARHKFLEQLLHGLCRHHRLTCHDDGTYSLSGPSNLIEAILTMNPRGFGFAVPVAGAAGGEPGPDLFIPPPMLGTANHGDRVLVQVEGKRRGRPEARVVRVVERSVTRLVGIYFAGSPKGYVVPEDDRFTYRVLVANERRGGAGQGEAVIVEIVDFKEAPGQPEGRIVKVLGNPEELEVQTRMVLFKYGLADEFDPEVLDQADRLPASLPPAQPGDPDRVDLRHIAHVTIDGASARDFDDAVVVQKTKLGYRLHVSIADVSHYVIPDSPLDKEAYQRGTSVYFPTRAVPMLPERLSNDLCSLVPDRDRPAFTAVLDFDHQGKRTGKKFMVSLIRSHYRFTYDLVRDLLEGTGQEHRQLKQQLKPFVTPLERGRELAALLEKQRLERGSIGFSVPEAEIVLGPDDTVAGVVRIKRHFAHKMIEEFMLAANEAVAETFDERGIPLLYRIHEKPDPLKVAEFITFAGSLGLPLPKGEPGPAWFGAVLARVADTPLEYIINNLLLRTMQRARYAPDNAGHFGLAATHYCHFTSPIRRYPDLMVHRALKRLVGQKKGAKKGAGEASGEAVALLRRAGELLSGRERLAMESEREMTNRLQVRFMADKVGEHFEGVISGVTSFGIFVELFHWFVSGAAPVEAMRDDYYQYDDKSHRLLGSRTGRILQLGNLVRVRVAGVDMRRGRINFDSVELLKGEQAEAEAATTPKATQRPAPRRRRGR